MKSPNINRRTFLGWSAALAVAGITGCRGSATAAYPSKAIEVTVNYPAGGSTDVVARGLLDILNEKKLLGEQVTLVNRDGGAGTTGVAEVVRSEPDGYSIGFTTSGAVTVQPQISDAPFDVEDVSIIKQVAKNDVVVAVPADSEFTNLKSVLARAKSGGLSVGEGPSSYDFAVSLIEAAAGVTFKRVDFEGDAPMAKALLSGDVPVGVIGLGSVLPYVKSGDIRVLSVLGDKPSAFLDNVPVARDEGVDVSASVYFWLYGPPSLSEDVASTLSKACSEAASTDEFGAFTKNLGVEVAIVDAPGAERTADRIRESAAKVI